MFDYHVKHNFMQQFIYSQLTNSRWSNTVDGGGGGIELTSNCFTRVSEQLDGKVLVV